MLLELAALCALTSWLVAMIPNAAVMTERSALVVAALHVTCIAQTKTLV